MPSNTKSPLIKEISPVARIHTDYPTKFGIPRQCGLVESEGIILFEPEYANPDCLKMIEGFSHLWLIWGFSENEGASWSPTVRPPRLGGNRRVGVFASRSPFRPNGLGLSVVRLIRTENHMERSFYKGPALIVSGADLMDGTPIYDIKPYMPYSDSVPQASGGYSAGARDHCLSVDFPEDLLAKIPEKKREPLIKALSLDPRPSYHKDPEREYGMPYAEFDIHFQVDEERLRVTGVYLSKGSPVSNS